MTEAQLIKKIKNEFAYDELKPIAINTEKAEVLWLDTVENLYCVSKYEVTADWQIEWAPMPHESFKKI